MGATTIRFVNIHQALTVPVLLLMIVRASIAVGNNVSDMLYNDGNITDGKTLVSAGGTFTLGFFSPTGVPTKRYLGIWFSADANVVCWVANRDNPLNTTTGVLVISDTGSLVLLNRGSGHTHTTWSSSSNPTQPLLRWPRSCSSPAILWCAMSRAAATRFGFGNRSITRPTPCLREKLKAGQEPADRPMTRRRGTSYRRVMDTKGLPDCVSWKHVRREKVPHGPLERAMHG
ncbi:hypothetical protein PR202_gb14246 [Eleusine coracana subsp. coracana]|uniref:non-specific serine/threonine protein kinase n=1 Tax=Eleusine coracana subsp. coracana TaxID=191504 RepID=A0AAV5ESE8_ELECO|nr:hypothetical protein PR202_gb14246 [Eleusine coracana subsp. coracana]